MNKIKPPKIKFYPIQLLIFLPFLLLVASCSQKESVQEPKHLSGVAMTVPYKILIGHSLSTTELDKIQAIIQSTFHEIDTIFNKWNPDSELSRLNQQQKEDPLLLSPSLYKFLEKTDTLVKMTNGRFDPTVEPLQQIWKKYLEKGVLPPQELIESIRPAIGWNTLTFKEGYCVKAHSLTAIDLGGIAKGHCVDLIVERLEKAGFSQLYVEWGGEIRTQGNHPSGRPWRINISRLSDQNPENALYSLDLVNQSIATSGDYYQFWTVSGEKGSTKTFCHIFNPITLMPLEVKKGSVASASLVAEDCLTADALAKVLMLFDTVQEAEEWIKEIQITHPSIGCWIVTRD